MFKLNCLLLSFACLIYSITSLSKVIERPVSHAEMMVIKLVMEEKLKDPYSAQYSNVRILGVDKEGSDKVCGQVNAKNSYGAYIGKKGFFGKFSKKVGGRLHFDLISIADTEDIYPAGTIIVQIECSLGQ
jgi:hypothetical protein